LALETLLGFDYCSGWTCHRTMHPTTSADKKKLQLACRPFFVLNWIKVAE